MRHSRALAVAATVLLSLTAAACGGGNDDDAATTAAKASAGTRTVRIEMRDIAFQPKALQVKTGETIRFVFTNKGKVAHDAFVGDEAAQAVHEQEMQAAMTDDTGMAGMAGMGGAGADHGDHPQAAHGTDAGIGDEPAISLAPEKTGTITYRFTEAGEFEVACHQPGHYAGGMKIGITVT